MTLRKARRILKRARQRGVLPKNSLQIYQVIRKHPCKCPYQGKVACKYT